MAYIQTIETNVSASPSSDKATVQLSQNENGRELYFHILGVEIPEDSTATISGTKPDGTVYSKAGTVEGVDYVVIEEDTQMTAVDGKWDAKIRIANGGNEIATALITFVIEKDPVDSGAIPSNSQLDGIIAQMQTYANNLPALPTTAGNYRLKVTVSGGVRSYSWVSS